MVTIIIPEELKGTDVWTKEGKIEVREDLSLEDARRLEFMGVRIIEQESKPKSTRKRK